MKSTLLIDYPMLSFVLFGLVHCSVHTATGAGHQMRGASATWRFWRAREGCAEQRIPHRAATRRSAHTLSYSFPYPPPAVAPTSRVRTPWQWAPETSRPTIRGWAGSPVRPPGAATPKPCVTLAARQGDSTKCSCTLSTCRSHPTPILYSCGTYHSYNYGEWTMLDMQEICRF